MYHHIQLILLPNKDDLSLILLGRLRSGGSWFEVSLGKIVREMQSPKYPEQT
jgi:hypothetical protein